MWLHLGNDVVVMAGDVVGIFDLDNTTISRHTRELLSRAQRESRVITVSMMDLPKSFVVCQPRSDHIGKKAGKPPAENLASDGRDLAGSAAFLVYLSPVSPATLLKRSLSRLRFE